MRMENSTKITENTKNGTKNSGELVSTDEPEKAKKRTLGNKIYDFGVFGSIAWLGVSTMSALTAHEAMHGNNPRFNWLRTVNNTVFKSISSFLSKSVMKKSKKETVDAVANHTTMVFTLGMGGHTLMAPIKWLEDNRQSNAAKIDKMLGTNPPDAKEIADEPKQSWKSVLSGRMLSWSMAFATVLAAGPKLVNKVNDYFGKKGEEAWMKFRPKSNHDSVKKWSNLIAFDLIFTAVTAAVTYAFSRFVAKKYDVGDNLYELNPIAPNPLGEEESPKKIQKSFAQKVTSERKTEQAPSASFIEKLNTENNLGHART